MEIDLSNVKPQEYKSFEPIPAGWYPCKILEIKPKEARNGNGSYLSIRWEVIGQSHTGRKFFSNLTLRSSSEKAEEIGLQQLSQLCESVGMGRVARLNTDQLLGKVCVVKIAVKPAKDGYDADNEAKGFKPVASDDQTQVPFAAPQAPRSSGKPW